MLDWEERGLKGAGSVAYTSQPRTLSAAYPLSRVPSQPRTLSVAYLLSRVLCQYINKVQHSFSNQLFTKLCEGITSTKKKSVAYIRELYKVLQKCRIIYLFRKLRKGNTIIFLIKLLKAICKMGSKFVTLGSKVIFLGGNFFIFFEQQNYFFGSKSGQQELFFWAARIYILDSKYFRHSNSKFWFI